MDDIAGAETTDTDTIDLPDAITRLQQAHPWDEVAMATRERLSAKAPPLRSYVKRLPTTVFGLESGFFYLPAAQAVAWGIDAPQWLHRFLELLAVGHAHFAAQDRQIDSGTCPPELCLLSDVCLLDYLDGLAEHAPRSDPHRYRRLHDIYYKWYIRALTSELSHRDRLHAYSVEEIMELGLKAAPGNTTLHLVADTADRSDAAPHMVQAVTHLCTGLQLLDDLNDLDTDWADRNLTMPLSAVLVASGRTSEDFDSVRSDDLLVEAVVSGVAQACIEIAEHTFALARTSAARGNASVVEALALTWQQRAARRRSRLEEIRGLVNTRP